MNMDNLFEKIQSYKEFGFEFTVRKEGDFCIVTASNEHFTTSFASYGEFDSSLFETVFKSLDAYLKHTGFKKEEDSV
jgi:hypothetical protein